MKLAASNIGWALDDSPAVYARMRALGFTGLEIAPTKFFPQSPYSEENIAAAGALAQQLQKEQGLCVVSMQSIWYGRGESIWGSDADRQALIDYTEAAARFAAATGCPNLVFGCPRNRNKPDGAAMDTALDFFARAGDAAARHGVWLALEPNPPIYNTNFLNTTAGCAAFLRQLDHPALGMNLDVGTMLENGEEASVAAENLDLIRHVHFSRPGLPPVQAIPLHRQLADVLTEGGYTGWVSLEMKQAEPAAVFDSLAAVAAAFAD